MGFPLLLVIGWPRLWGWPISFEPGSIAYPVADLTKGLHAVKQLLTKH